VKKLTLASFITCFLALGSAQGQDVHFSQFFETPTMRNPGLTGIFTGDYKVTTNYRNQWGAFGVPYKTALVSGETKILLRELAKDYLSFGLTAVFDKAGSLDFSGTSLYGAVNYNKLMDPGTKTYLSVGLSGAYLQRSFDVTKMRTASQYSAGMYNPNAPTGENADFGVVRHYDASAGVSVSGAITKRIHYYVGAASYHVSKPKQSFYSSDFIRLTTRWAVNAGVSASLGGGYVVNAHANYQYQEPYKEMILGGMVSKPFTMLQGSQRVLMSLGCYYRLSDAIIPMIKMDYSQYSLSMSYDINASGKRMYLSGFGGYEMSLSIRGNYNHAKPKNYLCPSFEQMSDDLLLDDPLEIE
jgi:type IX secretion system PorP/SprF family membrane protein